MVEKRAGRRVFEQVRRERRHSVRKNWRILASIAVLTLGVLVFQWWLLADPFVRGLLMGVTGSSMVWLSTRIFDLTGSGFRRMGGEAEVWTSEQLHKLDRRLWRTIDDVPFDRHNIDHVVVGPGLVYAVETKWRSKPVSSDRPEAGLDAAVRQAEKNADRLRTFLRSVGFTRTVIPMIVVWGPGTGDMPSEPIRVRDVRICSGRHAAAWLGRLSGTARSVNFDQPVYEAIRAFVQRRDAYEASRS